MWKVLVDRFQTTARVLNCQIQNHSKLLKIVRLRDSLPAEWKWEQLLGRAGRAVVPDSESGQRGFSFHFTNSAFSKARGADPKKVHIKVMPVGLSKGHDGGSCGPHSTRLQNTKWNPSLFKCVGHACWRQWPPDDFRVRLVGPVKREDR